MGASGDSKGIERPISGYGAVDRCTLIGRFAAGVGRIIVTLSPAAGVETPDARRLARLHPALGLAVVAVLLVAVSASGVDDDSGPDVVRALGRGWDSAVALAARVSWLLVAALAAVSVLHYLAAAAALRAASGVRTPAGETVAAQLAASAANRLTPAGLGGAGLLARFLSRRGALTLPQATAAVSSLATLGGLADVAAFAVLIAAAVGLGVPGAAAEVPHLTAKLLSLVPFSTTPLVLISITAALAVAASAGYLVTRTRHVRWLGHLGRAAAGFGVSVGALVRQPRRVATLMGASAATTVVLSTGFAAAAVLGPTHLPATMAVPLMIGYMVAAAAGNAIPTPGGIGSADAAFVGVLVAAHASAGPALAAVLMFRVVTFWAPAVVGLAMTRTLRRAGAL